MGITVLSLFDGMSCGQIALKELGIKVDKYYASEIDKHAIKQTILNFPDTIQLGSVTDVDARKLGHIDLLVGGSPCFAAGTKVLTKQGYKNIEDIRLGEMVLTHKNRWRTVVDYGCKMADTFEVQTQCSAPIVCTADHNFWARKKSFEWKNEIRTRRMELGKAGWVEAEKLKNDYYVCSNRQKVYGDGLDITLEEAWVLGRYLADGHTRKDLRFDGKHNGSRAWQLILSIGTKKLDDVKAHLATLSYSCYPHSTSTYRVVFSNKKLVELAEKNCGCNAIDKFISEEIFNSSNEIKKSFLEGYLSGDGSINGNKVQICTVSHNLALGLQRLILDIEKVHSNIYLYDRGSTWELDGRTVNQHPQYVIHYTKGINGKVQYDDDKIWFGVKKYTHVGEQLVYNITVEEDHSYTVENVVVKNCTNFSFAGRRNGMNTTTNEEIYTLERYLQLKKEGFEFDGESFLFWEYMRILGEVREKNPDVIFFLENVEMGEKWEAVLTRAIGIPGVHINSALVSAQNRRRIYWTNIRTKTDGLFGWTVPDIPQPEDRGIMLADVLEEEVDGKYYLKDEVVDKLLADGVEGAESTRIMEYEDMKRYASCCAFKTEGVNHLDMSPTPDKCGALTTRPDVRENAKKTGNFFVMEYLAVYALDGAREGYVAVQPDQLKSNTVTAASHINKTFEGTTRIMEYTDAIQIREATKAGYVEIHPGECFDAENHNSETRRGRKMADKSNCLMAQTNTNFMKYEGPRIITLNGRKVRVLGIRRLTPTECSRLQTIPTWYKWECSDSQEYRMLGNGWTVEVIKHFFQFLPFEREA